jgi:hypothetical protein
MKKWSTTLQARVENNQITSISEQIRIQRGIYQGDSLSPLWFCLAQTPFLTYLTEHTMVLVYTLTIRRYND